jgi:hypothetical protein
MKGFHSFTFSASSLRSETDNLKMLLKPGSAVELEENEHLSPAFKASPNLVSIIGAAFGGVANPDLIAQEFWILDKLRCDFAVGNSRHQTYCFIELEDAEKKSVFVERKPTLFNGLLGRAPYYDWAPRFEHGTSQMLDWIRILEDSKQTGDYRAHFGSPNAFEAQFVLVIGREEFLSEDQKERLAWRCKSVQAAGHKVKCITYDRLLEEAEFQLANYPAVAAASSSLPSGMGPAAPSSSAKP